MRKSSTLTQHFRSTGSQNAERLARFREQMADFARGERLRELREQRHETQRTVANAIDVSEKSLREWEHGGKIKWDNAQRLGRHYSVDPESLVSRELPEVGTSNGAPEPSQLDRIEAKLDAILAAMGIERPAGPSSEGMAEALEVGGREVQAAIAQPPPKGSGRQGRKPGAAPRSRA